MKPTFVKLSPSTRNTPSLRMSATKKSLAVGRDADVLRRTLRSELQITEYLVADDVDLDEIAAEFAGEDRIASVDREVAVVDAGTVGRPQRVLQFHRVRIAEIEP